MSKPACRGALLTIGTHLGTLAAARDLGSLGISIAIADHSTRTLTSVSRYVGEFHKAPYPSDVERFAQWLVEFGEKTPGFFLYPSSDDLAWIIAHHQDSLRRFFYLYQPKEQATYTLLNKELLTKVAAKLDIPTPKTWVLNSEVDAQSLAKILPYPVIVKPKTQIGLSIPYKGIIVRRPEDLLQVIRRFKHRVPYKNFMKIYDPTLRLPLIQEYIPNAAKHIASISGFIDQTGELESYRGAIKRFQRPVKVGVGIGFESLPLSEILIDRTRRIAQEAGYFGVFEVEYVLDPRSGEYLIIDFNPRFYGQMAFDVARDLPLAQLAYAGACEDTQTMERLVRRSLKPTPSAPSKALLRGPLKLILTTQWLGRKMSWESRQKWLRWAKEGPSIDLLYDQDDPTPARIERWNTFRSFMRYPRGYIRDYFS
jgi:D-aspartate ligase